MTEPQSIKEYWATPERNRRHSAGRRESDYAVCPYHEEEIRKAEKAKAHICEKFKSAKQDHEVDMAEVFKRMCQLEERIIGRWTFGIVVTILLAVISISTGASALMFQSIKSDLKSHVETFNAERSAPVK
jgi:hypothetical protein